MSGYVILRNKGPEVNTCVSYIHDCCRLIKVRQGTNQVEIFFKFSINLL